MTVLDIGSAPRRPLWLPHPSLLAFIALLWLAAGAANLLHG